ncbi:MAG TPA: arabinofuranosidase catalytic domain-containing protein [Verrucomicrobiae bacterium]
MKKSISFVIILAFAFTLPVAMMLVAQQTGKEAKAAPPRPQGPCDIYAAAKTPCVAAHSTTRALYASYNGPLYQVMRQSDGKTLDIGVVQPITSPVPDAGGYADAAAQDAFCANTYCWITTIYDQSGNGNNLTQPPRGGFSGPALGGFDNVPVADWAPITIMDHKVYGVFIAPGMGLREDDAKGTAVDDQAEGQYWVVNGQHFNSGCCFDYGNAETDSHDDGSGTMETAYFGDATSWYHGPAPGPWVMTDQENNLVGCVNQDGTKYCGSLPNMTSRFVTGIAKGKAHHWTSMGGDAQNGALKVMFDGPRVNATYDPMRKQGAILLGNGGDNSNGSQGTFYEGAMTAAGTFPSDATDQQVQANIVAARYDVQQVSLAPASTVNTPPGLQTFSPGSSQDTTVTFKNITGAPLTGVHLSISVPTGWTSVVSGGTDTSKMFTDPIAPGASMSATFKVTSGTEAFNGDLVGDASWSDSTTGQAQSSTMAEKVRNVSPIKINEFAVSAGLPSNLSDSFIELYNAGSSDVDISGWSLTQHQTQQAIFSAIKIPNGTTLATHAFYLLGLSDSGLAVTAHKGDTIINVRNKTGMSVGDTVQIDTGSAVETHKIASVGTAAGNGTTLWQPLPDGPVITIPAGSTNVPVAGVADFVVGEKIALGYGATYPAVAKDTEQYEVATITAVGKPGTQAYLAADAKAGNTNIKVTSTANISVGDTIRLDIASIGHGIETVTVKHVGTAAGRGRDADPGTGLDLSAPLKFNHASNMPFSDRGTGISFQPATAFPHSSNEPLQPLGTGITLDSPLTSDHAINAVVRDAAVTTAGYQASSLPNQWFGGPALSPYAGNMVLRDAAGLVVDSLNYGGVVDPWASEGYQAASGGGQNGCFVPSPTAPRNGGRFTFSPNMPNRSAGRFPDGADTDSNCRDFLLQAAATLSLDSAVGANNIKVSGVDFAAGQTVIIDSGADRETAVIATVGTAGGTTVRSDIAADVTVVPVGNATGFSAGQTITIDTGTNLETATLASVTPARFGGGGRNRPASITVTTPLSHAHTEGAQVSGSGIAFTTALTRAHDTGAQVVGDLPTPGAPNQYTARTP